jgi:hypothetical protein
MSSWAQSPGLSNRIEIESYLVIESKNFAQIESNRMQMESNVFFNFRYDSIRFDLDANLKEKKLKMWQKRWKIKKKKAIINDFAGYFWHHGGFPLEDWPISQWQQKFHNCWQGLLSNRIVFWIESISNRKVSAPCGSKIESNRNRFDLTALADYRYECVSQNKVRVGTGL